ncbi:MAG TPA: ABC transporter permease [Bacteroides sp.]|nr:ABC transporter permease [Bacteroides sp.]
MSMFKNYFIIAFRNLLKYKVHSIVNILGLSVGIGISILILILVHDEMSYDKYNEDWQRIYRVNLLAEIDGTRMDKSLTPIALCETMVNEIPQVENGVRMLKGSHKKVSYKDIHMSADEFYYADDSYFKIFSIPLIKGDPETVLQGEYTIVLTESTAAIYFEDEDPIGETLLLDNGWKFRVTGICQDVPPNSHYHFDYLASLNGILDPYEKEKWLADIVTTYILASEDGSADVIESYFPDFVDNYIIGQLNEYLGENARSFTDNDSYGFYLQPLSDIHLSSKEGDFEAGTDKVYILVFVVIALFILVIACVNFMNLATAKSAARSKEVAIRKVVGATRRQISMQFLSESVIFSFVALALSFVVLELLLRPFNAYTGKELDIFYFDKIWLIPVFLFGALMIGVFAGSYPAFYLSSFKVLNILKGRNFEGMYSTRLRGFLVLSQFTVTIVLFISSMIINQQVKFFRESNLGFNRNNIVVLQRAYAIHEHREEFKQKLLDHPRINAASVSMALPGMAVEQFPFRIDSAAGGRMVYLRPVAADYDFLNTMQMHVIKGGLYENDDSTSYGSLLINEAAARELGYDDPVGMTLTGIGLMGKEMEYTVKGVIKDYHYESLHNEIKPLALGLIHDKNHPQYLSIRISGEEMDETLAYIQKVWKKFSKDEPFDYYFLDSHLDTLYDEEETTAHIFSIFTFLAIFIASLGLFGLAAHMAEQRTREIGIRKAMGASMPRITMMLSAQFTKWVIWANLIAFPIAYLGMKLWLGKFSYHINIEAWLFFTAALLALILALGTVIYQAMRSARANPMEALQYE